MNSHSFGNKQIHFSKLVPIRVRQNSPGLSPGPVRSPTWIAILENQTNNNNNSRKRQQQKHQQQFNNFCLCCNCSIRGHARKVSQGASWSDHCPLFSLLGSFCSSLFSDSCFSDSQTFYNLNNITFLFTY